MTDRSAGGVILKDVRYTYDALDRRIAVSVNGVSSFTVYDGESAWADYSATGNVTARYLLGDRIDEMLARWRPGEGTAWYLTDKLGTVRELLGATGVVLNRIDYDSFGRILSQTNPSVGDRFSFTGREFDAAVGLYYYRARFYDPVIGRFNSEDPLRFEAGDDNLYRYVRNNPIRATDPFGLETTLEYAIIAGTIAGGISAATEYGCKFALGKSVSNEDLIVEFAKGFAGAVVPLVTFKGVAQVLKRAAESPELFRTLLAAGPTSYVVCSVL